MLQYFYKIICIFISDRDNKFKISWFQNIITIYSKWKIQQITRTILYQIKLGLRSPFYLISHGVWHRFNLHKINGMAIIFAVRIIFSGQAWVGELLVVVKSGIGGWNVSRCVRVTSGWELVGNNSLSSKQFKAEN